jgi:glycerol-3-phosphate acyltransferase PlsY
MLLPLTLSAAVGYVLGALPFGYLVARAHGVNIFEVGSRNPGATNVKRVLGSRAGNLVFALDAFKGAVAAGGVLGARLRWEWSPTADGHVVTGSDWLLVGIAGLVGALLGHSFSCFTRFKGGKGVATGAGGFLMLAPLVTLIGGVVWVLTFYASRYVSLASILSALSLPAVALALGQPLVIAFFGVLVAVFVVVRHRANIARLRAGTEPRFARKSANGEAR